jgi:hypothetical protein
LSSRWCFYRCSLYLISVQSEQQSRNHAAIAAVLSFSVLFFSSSFCIVDECFRHTSAAAMTIFLPAKTNFPDAHASE